MNLQSKGIKENNEWSGEKRVENMRRRKEESGDLKISWERRKRMKIKTMERKGELEARRYF